MDTASLTFSKELHFPVIRAVPSSKAHESDSWFKRIIDFALYRRDWEVMEDYVLWSEYFHSYLFIPKGFIYDGASIPKVLNSIYSPTGILFLGAGPHDLGYRYEGILFINVLGSVVFRKCFRSELDEMFNQLCASESHMKSASRLATVILGVCGIPT
jgi:hypothetical protein